MFNAFFSLEAIYTSFPSTDEVTHLIVAAIICIVQN